VMRPHWGLKQFKALAGPCPKCGGTDRFGISRRKNLWHCRSCHKGGGPIDLVMHLDGIDFRGAIAILTGERAIEISHRQHLQAARVKRSDEGARIKARGKIWHPAKPPLGTLVEIYLRSRGIHDLLAGDSLRFHPACPFRLDDGSTVRLPAMIGL